MSSPWYKLEGNIQCNYEKVVPKFLQNVSTTLLQRKNKLRAVFYVNNSYIFSIVSNNQKNILKITKFFHLFFYRCVEFIFKVDVNLFCRCWDSMQ